MIDLSKLTPEEITRLENEIQQYKEQNKIVSYQFTMRVAFKPIKHRNDMLTSDGEPDGGLFEDYLIDEIVIKTVNDFGIDGWEEKVSVISCGIGN